MPKLTIFTAPKPFTHPHIDLIQRNAIRSWLALSEAVEVFLIGAEEGAAEVAREYRVGYLPEVVRNAHGTPLISSIFHLAREHSSSPLLAYVNADIILLPDLLAAAELASARMPEFMLVGRRWDLEVTGLIDFSGDYETRLRDQVAAQGRLHVATGSDYFLFPRGCFTSIPDFAIGRAGWDNWMIYQARAQGWPAVDCSEQVMIIHQQHDYHHLPGGQPHYRLPETGENVRLAGGKRVIFHLRDCNRRMTGGRILRPRLTWDKFWREVEIFPLISLRSKWLAQVFFAVFHPVRAYREFRQYLRNRREQPNQG